MYLRPQREEEQEHAKEIEAGLQSETMKKKTEETNKKKEGGGGQEEKDKKKMTNEQTGEATSGRGHNEKLKL